MSPFDQALSVLALAGVLTAIGATFSLYRLRKIEREIRDQRAEHPAE